MFGLVIVLTKQLVYSIMHKILLSRYFTIIIIKAFIYGQITHQNYIHQNPGNKEKEDVSRFLLITFESVIVFFASMCNSSNFV